jgi:hypothetical protein
MPTFNKNYFTLFLLILATEFIIALYIHDAFIRPYVGDVLVVVLIYCFVKAFLNTLALPTALGVLIFSYVVETLQYFNIVEVIGLGHSRVARIVIGSSFSWLDILSYTAGIAIVLLTERRRQLRISPR